MGNNNNEKLRETFTVLSNLIVEIVNVSSRLEPVPTDEMFRFKAKYIIRRQITYIFIYDMY
jgi:hypothetical protein